MDGAIRNTVITRHGWRNNRIAQYTERQYKEVSESEYVYSEREPSDLEGYLQRYSSEYPFFYCREVAWLPSKGVALCVFKKKEDGYKHKLDQHLVDGTCELFWRSQAAAIHYVGRFRLVEGVFPYEDRELASIRKELKKATRMHPTRSRNVKYEFVVLEYMGRTDDFVEPLIRGGFMRRSDEPLV